MTPMFRWVFLLALVGRAASVPRPIVVEACALLCNPGAETENEQERDPVLFPRFSKVNCRLQSSSDEHQAWVIISHCLKLCNYELSIQSEVNCFALRSSLQASNGCYCEALTPLSPNTMRLHENWRLDFYVKELAKDVMSTILKSPLDTLILCEIHQELFKNVSLEVGQLVKTCQSYKIPTEPPRTRREETETETELDNEKESENPEMNLNEPDNHTESPENLKITLCESDNSEESSENLEKEIHEEDNDIINRLEEVTLDVNEYKTEYEANIEIEEEKVPEVNNNSSVDETENENDVNPANEENIPPSTEENKHDDPWWLSSATVIPDSDFEKSHEVLRFCKLLCEKHLEHEFCNCKNVNKVGNNNKMTVEIIN
ncbi:uncharacterized protein LOC105838645 [Monomorium pharaonis]|uniref:uncharacterized protein LOC105838645 n=1 Tax=Monomorium pharaonis TaxID=307658 RepID=UPI00063F497F|nr:uncharacterized protein LOC105838645 [Monomorium pharaonis]